MRPPPFSENPAFREARAGRGYCRDTWLLWTLGTWLMRKGPQRYHGTWASIHAYVPHPLQAEHPLENYPPFSDGKACGLHPRLSSQSTEHLCVVSAMCGLSTTFLDLGGKQDPFSALHQPAADSKRVSCYESKAKQGFPGPV